MAVADPPFTNNAYIAWIQSYVGSVKIDEVSLSGTGAIDFQNIPQTFKHLEIVAFLRGVSANNEEALRLRFNNDSSTTSHGSYSSVLNATASNSNDSSGAYIL